MAQAEKNRFKDWSTYELVIWIRSFEDFILTTYQVNNLHLYYEALVELYKRNHRGNTWLKLIYFYKHGGTYTDFLNWYRGMKE